MNRYYVLKDGSVIGSAGTKENAIDMIQQEQKRETHYMLRASFSIIYGSEEFIPYEKKGNKKQ